MKKLHSLVLENTQLDGSVGTKRQAGRKGGWAPVHTLQGLSFHPQGTQEASMMFKLGHAHIFSSEGPLSQLHER